MELLALHLKRNGSYICRIISFKNCDFMVKHTTLFPEQERIYNEAATLWQDIYKQVLSDRKIHKNENFPSKDDEENGLYHHVPRCRQPLFLTSADKGNSVIEAMYWGANQRFFKQLCVAVKVIYISLIFFSFLFLFFFFSFSFLFFSFLFLSLTSIPSVRIS